MAFPQVPRRSHLSKALFIFFTVSQIHENDLTLNLDSASWVETSEIHSSLVLRVIHFSPWRSRSFFAIWEQPTSPYLLSENANYQFQLSVADQQFIEERAAIRELPLGPVPDQRQCQAVLFRTTEKAMNRAVYATLPDRPNDPSRVTCPRPGTQPREGGATLARTSPQAPS
jgi:hypothetical protein